MRHILVVDDNAAVLKATMKYLERKFPDARVVGATTGDDALIMIETVGFDAVVSDVEMPDMHGFALQEQVRALPGRETVAERFIFHTGGTADAKLDELLGKARFNIRKGDIANLVVAIEQVLTP